MKMMISLNSPIIISVQTNATKSRYVGAKTMTKLLSLGGASVKTNIAKLCYVGAKMTINLTSPIVILVQTSATESRYVGAIVMSAFNNKTFAKVETC